MELGSSRPPATARSSARLKNALKGVHVALLGGAGSRRIYNGAFPTFSALATMIAAPPAGWLDHDPAYG